VVYIDSLNVEITGEKNMSGNISEINNNFYEKYNPRIRAIVARILNNANRPQDIDDCVNTVFLGIMEKLKQYNETRGSMGAFVAMIARSVALNYCRDNMRSSSELIGSEKIDYIVEPLEVENKIEFQMLVDTILKNLNGQESVLFAMKYIYFYSPEEISKTFKINRNAVDGRVNRLKKKIKKLLLKGGITI
jgi:RNA polymerase sigma-70 factor (ECF subfamily)